MSDYDDWNSLNDLNTAEPLDGSSPAELLEAHRQLKAITKNTILTAHYPDGRLRSDAFDSVPDGSVGTGAIADGSVTEVKIAAGAVSADKLKDDAVTGSKIADEAIASNHFGVGSIPTQAFADNTLPLTALADYITSEYIAASDSDDTVRAITADAIANSAVTDRAIESMALEKLTGGADQEMLINVTGTWTSVAVSGGLTYNAATGEFEVETGVKAATFADAKNRGSAGGQGTPDEWNIRTLGEIDDPDGLMNFSSSAFRLAEGKYLISISCPASAVGKHQARLFNLTENIPVFWGTSETSATSQTRSVITGIFEVADDQAYYQVEHYIETSNSANDLGVPSSSNNDSIYANHREIYTSGYLTKI